MHRQNYTDQCSGLFAQTFTDDHTAVGHEHQGIRPTTAGALINQLKTPPHKRRIFEMALCVSPDLDLYTDASITANRNELTIRRVRKNHANHLMSCNVALPLDGERKLLPVPVQQPRLDLQAPPKRQRTSELTNPFPFLK